MTSIQNTHFCGCFQNLSCTICIVTRICCICNGIFGDQALVQSTEYLLETAVYLLLVFSVYFGCMKGGSQQLLFVFPVRLVHPELQSATTLSQLANMCPISALEPTLLAHLSLYTACPNNCLLVTLSTWLLSYNYVCRPE